MLVKQREHAQMGHLLKGTEMSGGPEESNRLAYFVTQKTM
jgi:hypothetical protein